LRFWDSSALIDPHGVIHRAGEKESAGNFGRLTKVTDLPSDKILKDFILQAMAINEKGQKPVVKKAAPAAKAEIAVPDYFVEALAGNPTAKAAFDAFSPLHKKECLQWITEAKTDATRVKRMEQAMEMMSEGNQGTGSISSAWKSLTTTIYQSCARVPFLNALTTRRW
jgi:uncharacterized protein YdeI (YjbR/CyaY-like superfamily)